MKIKKIVILVLMFFFYGACVPKTKVSFGKVEKRYTQFGITPVSGWKQKQFNKSDLYFENELSNAAVFFHAQCEHVSDSPLEALFAQLIMGITNVEIIQEEKITLADREALVTSLKASIDGVPRLMKIMVLRKNRCVFDAVFNAPIGNNNLIRDFDQMLKSFWAEAKL